MAFEDTVAREVQKVIQLQGDKLFDSLVKDVDARLRKEVEDVMEDALKLMVGSLSGGVTASGGSGFSQGFQSRVGSLFASVLQLGIAASTGGETVQRAETARSRESDASYRGSRAQQQSQLIAEAERGKRNQ